MNIALVTSEYPTSVDPWGGLATYTAKVAALLRNEGHHTVVCTFAESTTETLGEQVPVLGVKRRRPIPLLKRTRYFWRFETPIRRYLDSRRLFRCLVSCDTREPIDVVHLASYQSPGLVTAGSHRWPTITRFSSLEWLWRGANRGRLDASERLLDRFENRQARSSTATCSPSAFLARKVKSSLGLTTRIVRTPPPVAEIDGSDASHREPSTVAFVGSCNRIKGFDLFLDVIESLLKEDPSVRVEIAGRFFDASPLLNQLDGVLKAFPNRVLDHGLVDPGSVSDIYRRASCVVIPSRVDNYSNVCL